MEAFQSNPLWSQLNVVQRDAAAARSVQAGSWPAVLVTVPRRRLDAVRDDRLHGPPDGFPFYNLASPLAHQEALAFLRDEAMPSLSRLMTTEPLTSRRSHRSGPPVPAIRGAWELGTPPAAS